MRKRTLIAIIISVILIIIVLALLLVNNMKYSECKEITEDNRAECYYEVANKTSTTGFHVRINLGSRIFDLI